MRTAAIGSFLEDVSTHWTAEMAFPAFIAFAHSVYLLQFVMLGGFCFLSLFAKCWNKRKEHESTTCEVKPAAAPAMTPRPHYRPTHRTSRAHTAVE